MLFLQKALSALPNGLSSVQVKTRLACFSFLLLKLVFAAHFCASEFSLPELRLFVLLRRTSFQESSGSVYYSIFDFQGSVLQKVYRVILAKALIFLAFFLLFAVLFFATACVYYHSKIGLSIVFLKIFLLFDFLLIFSLLSPIVITHKYS